MLNQRELAGPNPDYRTPDPSVPTLSLCAERIGSDGSLHMIQKSGRMDRSQRRPPHVHACVGPREARQDRGAVISDAWTPTPRQKEGGLLCLTARGTGYAPPPHLGMGSVVHGPGQKEGC